MIIYTRFSSLQPSLSETAARPLAREGGGRFMAGLNAQEARATSTGNGGGGRQLGFVR